MSDMKQDLTEIVRQVLTDKPVSRDDDFKLIGYVYKAINPDVLDKPFRTVMWYHGELDLPSFETIRRTRQKLQAENPDLRGEAYVKRINKQKDYIDKFVTGGKL